MAINKFLSHAGLILLEQKLAAVPKIIHTDLTMGKIGYEDRVKGWKKCNPPQ